MGDSQHTQNIPINKVIGENEKMCLFFCGKKHVDFLANLVFGYSVNAFCQPHKHTRLWRKWLPVSLFRLLLPTKGDGRRARPFQKHPGEGHPPGLLYSWLSTVLPMHCSFTACSVSSTCTTVGRLPRVSWTKLATSRMSKSFNSSEYTAGKELRNTALKERN